MKEIKLPVKWFSQLDSDTDQGGRMCNSSSDAMLAFFITKKPISGNYAQSDDNYLKHYVNKYGDTTNHDAQTLALRDLGINSAFRKDWSVERVIQQLEAGYPVVCGILHKGPIEAPTGRGHMVLVVGVSADRKTLYVHDPAGELDLIRGGYIHDQGAYRSYSVSNFRKRFELDASGRYTPGRNGWAREVLK